MSDMEGAEWHSGNFEFVGRGNAVNDPSIHLNRWPRGTAANGRVIYLLRSGPLKMNELREIDIMDGWTEAQSSPAEVTDEEA